MRIAIIAFVACAGWARFAPVLDAAQDLSSFQEQEQAAKTDAGWPRKVAGDDMEMTVYQPQVDSWDQVTLQLRAAVSVKKTGSNVPMWGTLFVKARTQVDKPAGLVHLDDIQLTGANFPGAPAEAKPVLESLRKNLNTAARTIALARLQASKSGAQAVAPVAPAAPVETRPIEPPEILHSTKRSLLVRVDGAPLLKPIDGSSLQRVVNSRALLLTDAKKTWYLCAAGRWFTSAALDGPWAPAKPVPPELDSIRRDLTAQQLVEAIDPPTDKDGNPLPIPDDLLIFVRTRPAFLIEIEGEPKTVAMPGTGLEYLENCNAPVFRDTASGRFFVLVTGRWFTAPAASGPWTYVPANKLPGGFSHIPAGTPQGSVRESVPGTPEAMNLLAGNDIPQTATLKRAGAQLAVAYDGDPQFAPIEGTRLRYVVNSTTPVIEIKPGTYYAVEDGVWFQASSAVGPWTVADSVPSEIYTIPSSSPLHFVTFVRIYGARAEEIDVGYTPGYLGARAGSEGVVTHDTSWLYRVQQGQQDKPEAWNLGPKIIGEPTRWGPVGWGWGNRYGWGGGGAWNNRWDSQQVVNNYNVYDRWSGTPTQPPRPVAKAPKPAPQAGANDVYSLPDGRVYRKGPQGTEYFNGQGWVLIQTLTPQQQAAIDAEERARAEGEARWRASQGGS